MDENSLEPGDELHCPHCRRWHPVMQKYLEGTEYTRQMLVGLCRTTHMIRPCTIADVPAIGEIINEAARKYRHAIPADCWHEPYMSRDALISELESGVSFAGWEETSELVGVMGIQPVRDATLIRHAYVRSSHQGRGIGRELIDALRRQVQKAENESNAPSRKPNGPSAGTYENQHRPTQPLNSRRLAAPSSLVRKTVLGLRHSACNSWDK